MKLPQDELRGMLKDVQGELSDLRSRTEELEELAQWLQTQIDESPYVPGLKKKVALTSVRDYAVEKKSVTIRQVAGHFDISIAQARTRLLNLERQEILKRVIPDDGGPHHFCYYPPTPLYTPPKQPLHLVQGGWVPPDGAVPGTGRKRRMASRRKRNKP